MMHKLFAGTGIVQQAIGQLPCGKSVAAYPAEYQLEETLPAELQTSLPSIEQIERELGSAGGA